MAKLFQLTENFIEKYKSKKPNWSPLSEFVYYANYSRYIEEEDRNESWWETVKRVVEGTFDIQRNHCENFRLPWKPWKAQKSGQMMYDKIFNFKFTPPGRGLWIMGTSFVERNGGMALNNCLAYDTEIVTGEGIKKIGDCVNTEQLLLTRSGKWVYAPIKSFGKQKIWKVVLERQGIQKVIYSTGEHRWFAKDRRQEHRNKEFSEFKTKELRSNVHRLQYMFGQGIRNVEPSRLGIAHGIAYGDGTLIPGNKNSNILRLCGEKDRQLIEYFPSFKKGSLIDGDTIIRGLPNYFKQSPSITETKSYLYGWLAGYFAADGTCTKNGCIRIASYNKCNLEFVRDVCCILGIGAYDIREETRESNLTGRLETCFSISFMPSTLCDDFFLIGRHKENFIATKGISKIKRTWIVKSISLTYKIEEVYCAQVDHYHAFTLAGNILTGNCGFVSTEDIDLRRTFPFIWTMDCLMLGVGVGFNTLGANKIIIREPKRDKGLKYEIPDSREGWVESLGLLLDSYFDGKALPEFDYSKIRPAGRLLKGFGGISSGPGPLVRLHKQIEKLLNGRIGDKLTSVDIVDVMNMIGVCVVAGNIRRSAEVALGEYGDFDYCDMKNPKKHSKELKSHRWVSNNSVFVKVGETDYYKVSETTQLNGEPGFVWLENIQKYGRMLDPPNWKDRNAKGVNPSLRKGTKILTSNGIFPIENLEGKEFRVIDKDGCNISSECFLSGKNKVLYELELEGSHRYYCTADHKWPILQKNLSYLRIKTKDLKEGYYLPLIKREELFTGISGNYDEGFMFGYNYGDGWITKRMDNNRLQIGFILNKEDFSSSIRNRLEGQIKKLGSKALFKQRKRNKAEVVYEINIIANSFTSFFEDRGFLNKRDGLPKYIFEDATEEFRKGFIDGLFSSDGYISIGHNEIGLVSAHKKLILDLSDLLGFYGIRNVIKKRIIEGNFPNKKDYGKKYESYQISIKDSKSIIHFRKLFKLSSTRKQRLLEQLIDKSRNYISDENIKIKSIKKTGLKENVWDINVFDEDHTFQLAHCLTGNCIEQTLWSGELCNLVEIYPSHHETLEEFLETLKYAYLYSKTVTLVPTHWEETNQVMMRNRRIGASQSGIIDAFVKHGRREMLVWSNEGYKKIKEYDEIYSDWLCIPKSIKVTSVKPSGTVSLLAGVSPGIHYPHSKYYIQRFRIAKNSNIVGILEKGGYDLEESVCEKNHLIVSFPVHHEIIDRSKMDVTIWEQVKNAVDYQRFWADNNISNTVTFKPEEAKDISRVLEAFEDQLKGISFLPQDHGYEQAPFETITKEQYEERAKQVKPLDFSIYKSVVNIGNDKFCDTDTCQIVK